MSMGIKIFISGFIIYVIFGLLAVSAKTQGSRGGYLTFGVVALIGMIMIPSGLLTWVLIK